MRPYSKHFQIYHSHTWTKASPVDIKRLRVLNEASDASGSHEVGTCAKWVELFGMHACFPEERTVAYQWKRHHSLNNIYTPSCMLWDTAEKSGELWTRHTLKERSTFSSFQISNVWTNDSTEWYCTKIDFQTAKRMMRIRCTWQCHCKPALIRVQILVQMSSVIASLHLANYCH